MISRKYFSNIYSGHIHANHGVVQGEGDLEGIILIQNCILNLLPFINYKYIFYKLSTYKYK